MKKIKILLVLMAVSVIFSGCDMLEFKKPKKVSRATSTLTASGPIVATVNGHSIGLDDLNSEIELYNARVPQDKSELRLTTTEQKTNYLKNEMVQRILFYQEALDRGLNNDPEVQREIEQTKIQMLVYKLMQDLTNSVNVTDQDVRDYYDKLPDEYKKEPQERKIREIVVNTESQAKELLIRILQGENFSSLARDNSKAASASKGGDLGYIQYQTAAAKFKGFADVAFSESLTAGQASSAFKGPEGYYIVKLETSRGGKPRDFNEMKSDLEKLLKYSQQQNTMEELVGELSSKADIIINEGEIF